MVTIDRTLRAVAHGIRESALDGFPLSAVTFATVELDPEGEHAGVTTPVVEIQPIDHARNNRHNTSFVGYVTDDSGQRIGRRYRALFTMDVAVDVVTAAQSDYDDRSLAGDVRDALWYYDETMLDNPLPDPDTDGGLLYDVKSFVVTDGEPDNDFGMSPAARRSRIFLNIRFVEEVSTVDYDGEADVITSVEMPGDGNTVTSPDDGGGDDGSPSIELQY